MMSNVLEGLSETVKWHLMVQAAKRGLEASGYQSEREPGRGLSNVWTITKNGKSEKASIRTTRDRWIAFPPLDGGKKWKTLDEVDVVVVATVDDRDDPKSVEVYKFPAADVRGRFDAAFAARTTAGQTVRINFGMWVGLDQDIRKIPRSVGSGIVDQYKPIAVYPIAELLTEAGAIDPASLGEPDGDAIAQDDPQAPDNEPPLTIPEAKRRLALTFGCDPENIKIIVEA